MGEVGCLKDGCFQNIQVEGTSSTLGNLRYKRNIISEPVTGRAFTAEESGSIIYLSVLDGNYTLPPAEAGLEYYFVCGGEMDDMTITCAGSTDCFFGTIKVTSTGDDKSSADETVLIGQTAADSNVLTLDGDATTSGGSAGDILHVVAINANAWLVAGVLTTSHAVPAALDILG